MLFRRVNVAGTVQPAVPSSLCTPGPNVLCLSGGRFKVELAARDQRTDNRGPGVSIPQSDLFGYFSIPALTGNASNAEVFVKERAVDKLTSANADIPAGLLSTLTPGPVTPASHSGEQSCEDAPAISRHTPPHDTDH